MKSRALFEKALALDANFADAMAGLAWTYVYDYMNGWTSPDTNYDDKIFMLTERSIKLVPNNAYAYAAKALYLILTNRARPSAGGRKRGTGAQPQLFDTVPATVASPKAPLAGSSRRDQTPWKR